jgi:hypothetical protein
MTFKVGQRVRLLNANALGWSTRESIETEVLGKVGWSVVVFRLKMYGGYRMLLDDGRVIDTGWKLDEECLVPIEDNIKPIIPYPHMCKCGNPARKTKQGLFCSNRKCKTRKNYTAYFKNYNGKFNKDLDKDGFLICLECGERINTIRAQRPMPGTKGENILFSLCCSQLHRRDSNLKLEQKFNTGGHSYIVEAYDIDRIQVKDIQDNAAYFLMPP